MKKKKTYSMDREDLVISDYFKNKKEGFYIDIGCYHPIHRNNTFLLYKIQLFEFLRPKDLNYNFAVSNKNEKIKMFYQKELSQLSTINYDQAVKVFQGAIKEREIQSYTLNEVLKFSNLENKKIDLLDIDVEGADLKVLQGFSFEKFKPELMCVEIHDKHLKESEIYKLLNNLDYELIWSGVFSHIFRSKS